MNIKLVKKADALLYPADEESAMYVHKLKLGQVIHADFKKMRNYRFFKKFWSLVSFAFENWEPEPVYYKGQQIEKNFDEFRKNLIVLAGHHSATFDINGGVHLEAKSISFGKMSEEDFEKLYSAVIDVILRKVLTNYTEQELQDVIMELMSYA